MTNEQTAEENRTRQITIVAFCLIATMAVLYLLTAGGPSGNGNEPVLQVIPEPPDSLEIIEEPDTSTATPTFWTQPRGIPGGNASWGQSVVAPFDTVWRIHTGFEFFSAPALCEGRIYLGCNDGKFRALNIASGSTVWSYSTTCGICGEAAVDSEGVYFGGQDGYVYALNRQTGSLLWKTGLGYHIFSDAAILADTLILSGNSMGQIAALDISTGELIWNQTPGGLVLGPCIIDSLAVFSSEDGVIAVYDTSGNQLWKREFSGQASAPSASSDAVYAGFSNGVVRKMSIRTGETLWETDLTESNTRTVLSRPILANSSVLVGSCDNRLVRLDSTTGGIIWEQEFENWVQVPPVISDSIVYISGDDQRLHLLDFNTGEFIDSLETGGYSGTAPLLIDDMIFFGTASGELFAIRGLLPEPLPEEQE